MATKALEQQRRNSADLMTIVQAIPIGGNRKSITRIPKPTKTIRPSQSTELAYTVSYSFNISVKAGSFGAAFFYSLLTSPCEEDYFGKGFQKIDGFKLNKPTIPLRESLVSYSLHLLHC